ncbi:MAG TPA: metallophosphoesterase [Kofleriaceae bacterium]|nr:metallophosphoesterase [Kofleriaceae bacterium]
MIAYLTDVEGRWDKLVSFATGNPHVRLDGTALRLADGVTFVFGGDSIDRGPHGRRILTTLVAAKRAYGDRVVLLAGNRDLNKLRLAHELDAPREGAPDHASRGDLLRWIFRSTMGAPRAFAHRAAELGTSDDDAVVDSFLADLRPGGAIIEYLRAAQLAYRAGASLFVHGGVTRDNLFVTPNGATPRDVDAWVAALNQFFADELAGFAAGRTPTALIAYQAPVPGTHLNQASVVYARPTDDEGNPHLPERAVIAHLRAAGVDRVVVGHTPSGDCPALLHDDGFELVLGDNSYGRIELGSQLAFSDDVTTVRAMTELDDGTHHSVAFAHARADRRGPLGHRDRETEQLAKARLADGRFLLFRGLPERRVEQRAVAADALAARPLEAPYALGAA